MAFGSDAPMPSTGPAVIKHWEIIDGRQILFEEVSLQDLAPLLLELPNSPQANYQAKPNRPSLVDRPALIAQLGKKIGVRKNVLLASASLECPKAVTIDY